MVWGRSCAAWRASSSSISDSACCGRRRAPQRVDEADAADEATHHREALLPESCADRLRVVRRVGGKRERAEGVHERRRRSDDDYDGDGYDNDYDNDDGYDYYYLDLSPAGSGAEAARHLFGALRWAEAVARRSRKTTTTTTGRDLQRNPAADGADGHGDGHGNEGGQQHFQQQLQQQ